MISLSKETARYSLRNLKQSRARSALTILSIFVGIMTIFIFVSFGWGLYDYVNAFAGESSADKISIMTKGGGAPGIDDTFVLTDEDLRAIERVSGVYETEGLYTKVAEIKQRDTKKFTFAIGYEPEKALVWELANIKILKGRDLKSGDKGKVVLGYNYLIDDKIFPNKLDLNSKITIQGEDFRVIGFVESVGNPQDDAQIYMLQTDIKDLYGKKIKGYNWIIAKVNKENIPTIIDHVERNLRQSRNLDSGKEDFYVQSWQEMLETYTNVLNGIVGFIILIALISVFVSAINTANTMITSVLERTREIGVIKSIGARNSEIFGIFLFESGVLGFTAGIVGVWFGFCLTYIAGELLTNLGWGFLSPHYSISLFVGCILFATITGAISGAIPAYRASRINPVEALRYE